MNKVMKGINIILILACFLVGYIIIDYLPIHLDRYELEPEDVYLDIAFLLLIVLAILAFLSAVLNKNKKLVRGLNLSLASSLLILVFMSFGKTEGFVLLPLIVVAGYNYKYPID